MKLIAGALAVLLLAGATVVLAAGSAAAPTPKKMSLACAEQGTGKLQYVSTALDCPQSRGKLVRFPQDRPVHACQLDKPNGGTKRTQFPPAHSHNVTGMLFRVTGAGACHAPKYPNSHHVVLPKLKPVKLCAGKREGTVRVVNQYSQCNSLEFAVVLAKAPAPPNHAPKANDQKVDVNENTPKSITLSGSDPDHDPLTFSIAKQPSHGTLSGSGRNRTYTPATNYSGPDSFKFKVSDGHGHSDTGNVTITVHQVNDAPIINTSAGATPYTENGASVAIDAALTVTDSDSSSLTGATVRISGAFQAGDALGFSDTASIHGTYDTGTGVLTLTGTDTVANYQAALRSVKFSSTNDAPSTPKTIRFQASDGTSSGPPASKSLSVTPVNDAPTLTTTAANLSYTEGDGPVAIDGALILTDPDSASMQGATVQVTGNFVSADDELSFSNSATPAISGSYDDTTGTLTLSGTDTLAHYRTALRAVKYENTNPNPSGSKTVSFQATDAASAASNVATRTIDLQNANTAPTVATTSGTLAYTEGDAAKQIDAGVTVSDPDDTSLASAKVRISAGFQAGDDLSFTPELGITGNYDSSTGVLTLTGPASTSDFQQALRDVKFSTTTDNPSTSKTVEFTVDDGHATNHASNAATKGIAITPVNDAPTLNTTAANLTYTEGDGAVAIDSGLTASDPDSATLTGATVQIVSNFASADDQLSFDNTATPAISGSYDDTTGTLTLSGSDTVAHYQAALRAVKYENTNPNPSGSKLVRFQANDGSAFNNLSNTADRTIDLQNANTAPTVATTSGTLAYTEGDVAKVIDAGVTVSDPDDTSLASAKVRISAGFQAGDDLSFTPELGITGDYDSSTGVLTLTGPASVSDFQQALRDVKFSTTNDDPSTSKTVEFTVDDGHATNHGSNAATRGIAITPVNDAPTLTTTAANLSYTEGDGAVAIDAGLTATDPDSTNLVGATVQVTGNFASADDQLSFDNTATPAISGSYDDSTGTLTLSGSDTVAHYQAALRAVKYENTNPNPSGSKTVQFHANDGSALNNLSNTATRTIDLQNANTAPTVATTSGTLAYTEGDVAKVIDAGVTVSDPDDTNLASAKVRISAGFQAGDDLQFGDTATIDGDYDSSTGVLTLIGSDTLAAYQAALESVKFTTTNDDPSTSKTVEFTVDDGHATNHASSAATKAIAITPVNDAPTITTTATNLAYTEGDGAVAIDNGLLLTDPDSANLVGATVQITTNFVSADDQLSFDNTATPAITGLYDDTTGTLTLSGSDTVAHYQAALRAVKYENASQNPSGSKTVQFRVDDGAALNHLSNTADRTIDLTAVNDAPHVTTTDGDTAYTEGDPATTVDAGVTVSDADDANLNSGRVRISTGFQVGDSLTFTNTGNVSGNYNSTTGVLTVSGSDTLANYQTFLRSVKFSSTNPVPSSSKTVEYTVDDGHAANHASNAATKGLAITSINSAPIVTAGGTLSYTENDAATAVAPSLTVVEPEGEPLQSASASINSNFQSGEDALSWTDNNALDTIVQAPSTNQTINLTGVGTDAEYQAALRAVKYANSSDNPSSLTRTVTFAATDAIGATGSDTRDISISPQDDLPVAVDDSATVTEDDPATPVAVLTNDTDVDGGQKTISSASDPANGTVVLTGGSPGQHTGLTYQPDPDKCNTDTGIPDTFTYTLNGGSQATVSMTVTCVNDNPVAQDRTFTAVGNTTLVGDDGSDGAMATPDPSDTTPVTDRPHKTSSSDIRDSATDVDTTPQSSLSVVAETNTTDDGGSVTLEADGDFRYEPKAGTSCTDHQDKFDYTVSDGQGGTDTGTVTVNLSGCVRYVNNDDADGNDGTSEKPYDTLGQAQSNSSTGDYIFVYDGNDTTTGYDAGIDLQADQKLIGEAATLTVGADTLHTADATNRPTITDSAADVVVMDDGNEVKGLEIDPSGGANGGGIAAGSGDVSGTIDDVKVIDDDGVGAQQAGLEIDSSTGTWNVSNLDVQVTSGATGIRVNNVPSPNSVNFSPSGVVKSSSNGGKALDVTGTGGSPTNLGSNSMFRFLQSTGSNAGGVGIVNATGTIHLGDGISSDLDLNTSASTSAGLLLVNAGTVDVPPAGTANIHANGGPAVDVQSTSGVSLPLDTVESTSSADDGINFDSNGTGTFSAVSGGTNGIKGATGIAVDVNGGNGDFTYPGKLDDGAGATADVTGRTGGTVHLSGAIADGVDAGGGITISGNSAGATTFDNASKVLKTTTGDAISIAQPDNSTHAVTFSNGGLDIDTTTGKGVDVTGVGSTPDGTLDITGTGNSITTTTGRGLNLDNAAIGAGGLTFHDTSSNGASNGISLSNTGSSSGLTVTGDGTSAVQGGDNSGGTIQQSTGTGVFLSNTKSPSFTNLKIDTSGHGGLTGSTGVHSLTFTRGRILSSGHKSGVTPVANRDAAFDFTDTHGVANAGNNLDGVLTVTDNVLSDNWGGNVHVANTTGTISNAVVTGNSMTNTPSDSTVATGVKMTLQGNGASVPNLTKANIGNNDVFHPRNSGITIQGGGAAVGGSNGQYGDPDNDTDVISIHDNLVRGGTPDGVTNPAAISTQGILVSLSSRGEGHADISNNGTVANPITNTVGSGIGAGAAGSMRALFNIAGNRVSANNFGGSQGISIEADKDGSGNNNPRLAASVTGNVTSNTDGPGLWANMHDTNGSMYLQIGTAASGNTFNSPTPHVPDGFEPGLQVSNGSAGNASFNPTTCADIRNNTSGASPPDPTNPPYHDPGIDLFKRSTSSTTYVFGIVGLTSNPATAAQTESYVGGLNPNSGLDSTGTKRVLVVAGSNFTPCTLPSPLRPAP